jgi:rod shape-determining protein MreB
MINSNNFFINLILSIYNNKIHGDFKMALFGKNKPETVKPRGIINSLGIDLGTLNTVIAKPSGDKFDLYQIPSVVAVKKDDPKAVLAVGEEAKLMLGRTPEDIVAIRPLRKGVIESIAQAQALLIKAMEIGKKGGEKINRIVIGIPGDSSEVERKAAEDIGKNAGADDVLVISEGLAAAIGAGLPIAEPNGTMVIDIGAGSTDLVIISLGGITDIETVRFGGDDIDTNLVEIVREKYNVEIGIHVAETAKIEVGMFHSSADLEIYETEVIGKSADTNRPQKISIDSTMVADAAEPVISEIIKGLDLVFQRLSPELVDGVYKNSVAVGGSSQLRGLETRIYDELLTPITISDDPMTVVAKGAAIVAAEPRALDPEIRINVF